MAYQNEKQTAMPIQDEKQRPEEKLVPGQDYFGMPNSMMLAMPVAPPRGTPNSVMREMLDPQIPEAEDEADRLSAGIRYGTPNSVRKLMGSRLETDFSSVRFHTGPDSVRRNEALGARAYTRGKDVFFGSGGFEPSVAAHELVHTVQQRAVPGHVSQSVSFGTVQMKSWTKKLVDQVEESESPKLEKDQSEIAAEHGRPVKLGFWQRIRNFLHKHRPFARRRRESHAPRQGEDSSEVMSSEKSQILPDSSGSPDLMIEKPKKVERSDPEEVSLPSPVPEPKSDEPEQLPEKVASPIPEEKSALPPAPEPKSDEPEQLPKKVASSKPEEISVPSSVPEAKVLEQEKGGANIVPSSPSTSTTGDSLLQSKKLDEEEDEDDKIPVVSVKASEPDGKSDDKKDGEIWIDKQNQIGIFWENKTYTISVDDENMSTLEAHLGKPAEDEEEDDGEKLLLVATGEENDIYLGFKDFSISGQLISVTEKKEEAAVTDERKEAIFDGDEGDDDDEDDEDDPLIDRQVRQYINAHNEELRQSMEQDKGKVSSGGVLGKAKQAADILGALQSASSLLTETDRLIDTIGMGDLFAKQSSAEFEAIDEPIFGGATALLGTGASLLSAATNAVDTVNNARMVSQGANPVEAAASGTKTVASLASAGASGVKFLNTVGVSGVAPAMDFVPFVQTASGAFNGIVGFGSGIRHRYHLHRVHEQQRELEKRMNPGVPADAESDEPVRIVFDDDQSGGAPDLPEEAKESSEIGKKEESVGGFAADEEARPADQRSPEQKQADRTHMMRILKQAEMVEERKRTTGTLQGAQGAVAFGGGLASILAGPLMPAASIAIGGTSAGLSLGRFAYDKLKKSKTREQVISEDLGIDWKHEIDLVRKNVTYGKYLTPIKVRKIILRAHGFQKGTRHEAYAYFTQQRANFLMDQMESGNEDADIAENLINAVGIHRRQGRYQTGARQLLAQYLM